MKPCRMFKDPFRPRSDGVDNLLVMCDTYTPAGEPLPTNSRAYGTFPFLLYHSLSFVVMVHIQHSGTTGMHTINENPPTNLRIY